MRALLDSAGVRPSKARGQNFVVDPNTIRVVVRAARLAGRESVLEVGAGTGSLTLGLAAEASRVVALEKDQRLGPVLAEALAGVDNVSVLIADGLEVPLGSYGNDRMVSNLPYGAAATIVLKTLEEAPSIAELTVMAQREVGERLAARPGSRSYGATSVIAGLFGEAEIVGRVSRTAFYPVPRVDSVILRVVRRPLDLLGMEASEVIPVVKASFGQRRKSLRNALAAAAGGPDRAKAALEAAGVKPESRAERLGVGDFVAVARALSSLAER